MWMLGSGRVLQEFYKLRQARTGSPPPKYFRKGPWKHADAYLKWCQKNDIANPLGFLTYRFECGDHVSHVPKIHQLRSDKLAKLWAEFCEDQQLEDRRGEKLARLAGSKQQQSVKHLRVLTVGHEAVKNPYYLRGQHDLCLAEIDLSGGFHPESRYCPTCPAASRCVAKLYQKYGFDVVALRAGRLHDLPVDIAAAAVR